MSTKKLFEYVTLFMNNMNKIADLFHCARDFVFEKLSQAVDKHCRQKLFQKIAL